MAEMTSQQMAGKLLAAGFERSGPSTSALSDPIADTPMVVTLDQLRPYDHDPRKKRNPAYEDIKRKRVAEQEEEDAGEAAVDFISEIPLDLAEQITNFRHDRIGPEFFELVPGDAQKPKKAGFMSIFTSLLRGGRS